MDVAKRHQTCLGSHLAWMRSKLNLTNLNKNLMLFDTTRALKILRGILPRRKHATPRPINHSKLTKKWLKDQSTLFEVLFSRFLRHSATGWVCNRFSFAPSVGAKKTKCLFSCIFNLRLGDQLSSFPKEIVMILCIAFSNPNFPRWERSETENTFSSPLRFDYVRTGVQAFVSTALGIWFIIAYSLYNGNNCARPIPVFLLVSGICQVRWRSTCTIEGPTKKSFISPSNDRFFRFLTNFS